MLQHTDKLVYLKKFNLNLQIYTAKAISSSINVIWQSILLVYPKRLISLVLIEKQIWFLGVNTSRFSQACTKNTAVECALHGICLGMGLTTLTMNPKKSVANTGSYKGNKNNSIKMVNGIIKNGLCLKTANSSVNVSLNISCSSIFEHLHKKYDVADSIIQ